MHALTPTLHGSPVIALHGAAPWSSPAGRDFPLHIHDEHWELHYYRQGTIAVVLGRQVVPAHPGVFTVVPPGLRHGERALTDYANFWVQIVAPADWPWPLVGLDDEHGTIGGIVAGIVREHSGRPPGSEAMIGHLLAQLDILLRRGDHRSTLTRAEQLVRAAERTMNERIGQPLGIAEIADGLGVSTSRLRAAFQDCRGRSPLAVLHTIRAGYAVRLIQGTSAPLEAVAHSCGYDSASHLSRHIRREHGLAPGQLRDRALRPLRFVDPVAADDDGPDGAAPVLPPSGRQSSQIGFDHARRPARSTTVTRTYDPR